MVPVELISRARGLDMCSNNDNVLQQAQDNDNKIIITMNCKANLSREVSSLHTGSMTS